ncbi:MAG TPA: hypothetical protein VF167_00135 [Longimicrobiaceae bacterium]
MPAGVQEADSGHPEHNVGLVARVWQDQLRGPGGCAGPAAAGYRRAGARPVRWRSAGRTTSPSKAKDA